MAVDAKKGLGFLVDHAGEGLWRISYPMGEACYLVEGVREAALIDSMGGVGNLGALVRSLVGNKPVRVLLTHRHVDHVSGAYWFDEAWMHADEADCWDACERYSDFFLGHAVHDGLASHETPFGPRDGSRPRVHEVGEGDVIDLGGRSLRVVELPGHTVGSIGFLCPELRILFSGDAVTPIECLCFPESAGIEAYRETLRKMRRLPFERFWTGHHLHDFTKADLDDFEAAVDFVLAGDRGYAWHHGFIPDWEGTLHLCPCTTSDVDSCDFRAVITRGLPAPRKRRGCKKGMGPGANE